MTESGFDERSFLTFMMLAGFILAAMMTQFGQIQRVFNYFEIFYLLWLPAAVPPAFYEKEQRQAAFPLQQLLVAGVCVIYFVVILFFRSELWYDAMPYRFFWQ